MPTYESVLADASRLPADEQIRLATKLWETLPTGTLPPLTEDWLTEIRRRSSEYDASTATTIPWTQVQTEAYRRLADASR
jgi:putative addiction module component (TIGR02574 family)